MYMHKITRDRPVGHPCSNLCANDISYKEGYWIKAKNSVQNNCLL